MSAPRSINSAPNDTTPSPTLITPEARPAANAVAPDTSLLSSASATSISVSSIPGYRFLFISFFFLIVFCLTCFYLQACLF